MAKPKEQQPTTQSAVSRYIKEVRSEMAKVVWPSREQAINLTLVVMAVMIAMGIFLGLLDYFFGEMIQLLLRVAG